MNALHISSRILIEHIADPDQNESANRIFDELKLNCKRFYFH